jgi:NAD(P)-dependent dehydrogenase (short-subunit alcohol dehydrogenase family)
MPSETALPEATCTLITGGGSGIGRALALRLASSQTRVILLGRRLEPLQEVIASLPGTGHLAYAVDVTQGAAVAECFARLGSDRIRLSGLVHCAGIHWLRPLQLTTAERFQEMLESHLTSTFLLLKESVEHRAFARSGASVVLMSSAAALLGGPGSFAYASAKGGMVSAGRVAAVELANRKIRVNTILPGVVDTGQSRAFMEKMTAEQQEAIRRDHPLGLGTPDDVAAAAEFLLSPGARWITGTTLVVDGGLTAR